MNGFGSKQLTQPGLGQTMLVWHLEPFYTRAALIVKRVLKVLGSVDVP